MSKRVEWFFFRALSSELVSASFLLNSSSSFCLVCNWLVNNWVGGLFCSRSAIFLRSKAMVSDLAVVSWLSLANSSCWLMRVV